MYKKATQFLSIGFAALIGLGVAACPPVTSKTPVGSTVAAAPDPGLAGVWKGKTAGSKVDSYFTLFPEDDGTISAVVVTPPLGTDKGGWGVFSVQTVVLGPNHFMNVQEMSDEGKPATGNLADSTTPLLYRLNGDGALVLYLIDETAAKNAIKAGKIAGTIGQGEYGDVALTAPAADLDAYMASPAGRALFIKPFVLLRRVK
jgi:hypothetical protein